MDPKEQAEVDAWYTNLHSEYNAKIKDIDGLKKITTDAFEEEAKRQAAYKLLDELQERGEA